MNKKEEIKKLLITRMEVKAELNKLRFIVLFLYVIII